MSRDFLPSLTTEQMAEVDRIMIDDYGILLIQMMENAGRNLAEQAWRMMAGHGAQRSVVVLCGAGNNGGGGMVAARHLHNRGAQVVVKLAADPNRLKDVPAQQWRILDQMGLASNADVDVSHASLIVDALIGYGLSGDPRPDIAAWINRANGSGRPLLALDAPSGLDATTGVAGKPCIQATATLTLALPKRGLLTSAAKPFVGLLYLADIGVPPELYKRIGFDVGPIFSSDSIVPLAKE